MWLKVTDNKAHFATHFIHIEPIEPTEEIREKINLQVEKTGIVCYSVDELNKAKQILDELSVSYTVEELNVDPMLISKAEGVKYLTPEEVRKHLLEDAEPESALIPNLQKKLAEVQQENTSLKARLKVVEDAVLERRMV